MQFFDSLRNLVSGLGTAKDKTTAQEFALRIISDAELNAMHRSDWLARKVVDIIPHDMTREWREWQAKGDQIEAIEALERAPRINLQAKVTAALQKARLFGGAAIYIGIAGQDPSEPLELDSVGAGALEYLHLLHRHELSVGPIIRDVTSPFYGEPEYYTVTGANGALVQVHPSRMVRFIGAPIMDDRFNETDGWGDSVLQVVYDAVMNASSVQGHVAALIPEAKADVIYIPNLSEYLANATTTKRLTDRFTYANTMKSMFNMVLLQGDGQSAGEKWEQKQISFSQMPELLRSFLEVAAGAADIPVTRLLGQSPGGLNSTGESDLRNYYDNIAARQRTELSPALHRLDEVIIRSATGGRDPAIYYDWSPLWSLSEKERAEIFKLKADAARTIAGGVGQEPLLTIEALSEALANAIIEDGDLPGLEAAIEKYGVRPEQDDDDDLRAATVTPTASSPEE